MPWNPQPVFVLHADRRLAERVERASSTPTLVVPVADWGALRAGAATAAPGSMAVVDPRFGRADGTLARELRDLCAAYPRLLVLAVTHFPPGRHADALTLGAWGVAEVLRAGSDDRGHTLRARLEECYDGYLLRLSSAMKRIVDDRNWRGLNWDMLFHMAAQRVELADWARLHGVPEEVLRRRVCAPGQTSPGRQLAWGRVVLAADLLESPGHTVSTVAAALGYAGGGALRRSVHRLTGLTVAELAARRDPLHAAMLRFAREVQGWGELGKGW